jgi:hypothetical protein
MDHYVTLGPAVHHYVTLGRKVHQWRIGPESFGRAFPTTRHENHCFQAAGKFVVAVQRNCWRTRYFTKIRKFEKTTRVEFQLMILHF